MYRFLIIYLANDQEDFHPPINFRTLSKITTQSVNHLILQATSMTKQNGKELFCSNLEINPTKSFFITFKYHDIKNVYFQIQTRLNPKNL